MSDADATNIARVWAPSQRSGRRRPRVLTVSHSPTGRPFFSNCPRLWPSTTRLTLNICSGRRAAL